MRIHRTMPSIARLSIAAGVTVAVGDAIGISSGEAVLSDKDAQISVAGLAKSVQGSIVYIQTEGKFANADAGNNFWLGTNGELVNSPPSTGIVQQIAKRLDSQNILIVIDKTVIIL